MYQPSFDWFIPAYVQKHVALLQCPRASARQQQKTCSITTVSPRYSAATMNYYSLFRVLCWEFASV